MKKILAILIILLSLSNMAFAESNGIVKGHITVNGHAVEGAKIVLISEDMNTLIAISDKNGSYTFNGLPYGKYVITVKLNGKFYVNYTIRK